MTPYSDTLFSGRFLMGRFLEIHYKQSLYTVLIGKTYRKIWFVTEQRTTERTLVV
jgi:hypothetical protein